MIKQEVIMWFAGILYRVILNKKVCDYHYFNPSQQTFTTLEKRYDQLIKHVRSLEGDLADYNLALDKERTDTRPEEVR